MAFIVHDTTVYSFAEYSDVQIIDQRLFEANEGLNEEVVEDCLVRSTERILTLFRSSKWWIDYYRQRDSSITSNVDIPALDPFKIKERKPDFTDLCVYYALYNYVLPKIADFGNADNAEKMKMGYYQQKFESLFNELITAGDWYDFDDDGVVSADERQQGVINLRRVR